VPWKQAQEFFFETDPTPSRYTAPRERRAPVIVNAALVSGLISPIDIAISGGNLFVTDSVTGTIGEYNATTGAIVDAALISGLNGPNGIAVSGGNLFVTNFQTGTIGEYTISGETVNASLISGLNEPTDIAIVSASIADASSTWVLLLLALTATFGLKPLLHRPA
jgi:DNA-binding beta-propeller fold protein YncE